VDPRVAKPTCEWCGSPLALATNSAIAPEEIAPCLLTEAAARTAVESWLRTASAEVPDDFTRRARVLKLECAFFPFYLFSGVYSGWRGNGTISGGFTELLAGSGELTALRMQAPAYRFFAPPSDDVSLEDLSARVLNDLIEERRATVHADFCRQVLRVSTTAPLVKYTDEQLGSLTAHAFTEPFEAAEQRLKQQLAEHSKVKDIFFQELKTRHVLWPFCVAEISHLGFKYYCFVDASSPAARYVGGYKPIDPAHQASAIESIRNSDPGDFIKVWTSSATQVQTFTGDDAIDKMKDLHSLMNSLSQHPANSRPEIRLDIKKAGCFIATAAYGSEWTHEVSVLRRYRDEVLARSAVGRAFTTLYYRFSPPVARMIARSALARAGVRTVLQPLIKRCSRRLS
jgi:hypothetical protein